MTCEFKIKFYVNLSGNDFQAPSNFRDSIKRTEGEIDSLMLLPSDAVKMDSLYRLCSKMLHSTKVIIFMLSHLKNVYSS